LFFYVGFLVSALAVLFLVTRGNIIIFVLYIALFFTRVFGLKSRPYGSVVEKETRKPVPFAIIRISHIETGVEIMHRITDALGRYYCLLPNGSYYVRIDEKLSDGTYKMIAEKVIVAVTKGYLSVAIEVESSMLAEVKPSAENQNQTPLAVEETLKPSILNISKPEEKGNNQDVFESDGYGE
jgi:hypothetical protein